MPFRCRVCSCEAFEPVTVRRPNGSIYQSALLACRGCSAVFTDPERFSRPPDPPARVVSPPQWESRRTVARRQPGSTR
jgi:hypothetical protein